MANLNGLQFDAGFIGVLGTRGAGKSKLLQQMADGDLIAAHELQSFEDLTVTDYLFQMAKSCEVDRAEAPNVVLQSLERMNLTRFADCKIGELSPLVKSQTLLAKALLCDSRCLLLDDVLSGLSEGERLNIGYLLNEMGKERVIVLAGDASEPVDGLFDTVCMLHPEKEMVQVSANTAYSWVEGKVWEYIAPELPQQTEGRIITAFKQMDDGVYVREISLQVPCEEVSQVSPTLTDAYYWWAAQR